MTDEPVTQEQIAQALRSIVAAAEVFVDTHEYPEDSVLCSEITHSISILSRAGRLVPEREVEEAVAMVKRLAVYVPWGSLVRIDASDLVARHAKGPK